MLLPIRSRSLLAFLRIAVELSDSVRPLTTPRHVPFSSQKGTSFGLFGGPIIAPMSGAAGSSTTTSWRALAHGHAGDRPAVAALVARAIPALRRWAHGRLPRWARSIADTVDLVHDAVLHTIGRADRLDLGSRRALSAYLRQAVRNRVRDEHRRFAVRGRTEPLPPLLRDPSPAPDEQAISAENRRRYTSALARLNPSDRELIVAHVELDYSHEQLACMTGRTRNAARMALERAIRRLAKHMRDG
jgi:RNA polymerase sigma-70 factor, ECF subfamily